MIDNLTASQMLIPMALCLGFLGAALVIFLHKMLLKPLLLQRRLNSLGARGPSYKFFFGNTLEMKKLRQASMAKPMSGLSHDIYSRLQPHLSAWTKTYGRNFTFWFGPLPFLVLSEPELVKEAAADREKAFRKVEPQGVVKRMLGDGLVTSDGEKWVKMRKLANHAFFGESLKNMTPAMIASTEMMLERWKNRVGEEVEVYEEFRFLTAEVISRTAFGSNFAEGKRIFDLLTQMGELAVASAFKVRLPGIRYLFTMIYKSRDDTEADKLEHGVRAAILRMMRKREEMVASGEAENFGSDFFGLLLTAYHESDESKRISEDDLIDECKTVYLAGQETTNTLLSWIMLLLSIHTDWQEKARKEVQTHFGDRAPDADGISKLKTLSMIINETLRLYPPAVGMARKVVKEVQIGKHVLPKNTYFTIDTLALHQDPEIWGEDALQFNPERFSDGVAKATKNNASAFVPFGIGQRVCAGANFAANESKIALAMILQRYAFTLSPAYVHSPLQIPSQHVAEAPPAAAAAELTRSQRPFLQVLLREHSGDEEAQTGIHGETHVRPLSRHLPEVAASPLGLDQDLRPFLVLSEPDLVKEVAADREKAYRKVEPRGVMKRMLGDGLLTSDGEKWVKLRKLANHAFFGESLKAMIASTEMMLERWKDHVGKEIEVYEEFRFLTAEVISRTAFGSNFVEGKRIFDLLNKMVKLAAANAFKVRLPGIRLDCSKIYKSGDDIEADKLEQGVRALILGMLRKREEMVTNGEAENFGSDFCGLLLSAYHETDESKRISEDDLIDECKTVYLAGQETTNTLLSWVMLLLSIHTDWQEKARSEVQTHLGDRAPDADGISKLKTVSMIINETLRLYPPAIGMARRVVKEVQLGKHTLPKNTYFTIDTLTLHQDPEIWGEDALQFNPERFSEGVAKATKNNASAFVPFGIGQRVCAGANFAAHEAKIALAMILQRYAFTLSPTYVHSPLQIITIRPEHGVQVILHAL
ncbi:unnamed protein product [Linum tenue]|uniref:Cytochrome P450 n=1 Tax=Linum tenue TaxID=586396 RepID=A0AAV0MMD0_9ROSI|nr:unnamed protein product [Linum tenue]